MHDAENNDNMSTIVHDCVVALNDTNTNDYMTTSTDTFSTDFDFV